MFCFKSKSQYHVDFSFEIHAISQVCLKIFRLWDCQSIFFWISRLRASGVKWLWESYCPRLTSIGPKIDSHTPKTDYQIPKLNPDGLNSTLRDQISTFTFRNLNRTSRGKKSNVKAKNHSKRRKIDSKSKRRKFSSCRCKIDFNSGSKWLSPRVKNRIVDKIDSQSTVSRPKGQKWIHRVLISTLRGTKSTSNCLNFSANGQKSTPRTQNILSGPQIRNFCAENKHVEA